MKAFFIKNYIVVTIVAVVIIAGGAYWYVKSSAAPVFGVIAAGKGNVIESVDEPGSVMTEHSADLSFQESGQIARVSVSEGSVVGEGTVLASLDASQLSAAAAQANAGVSAAQAAAQSAQAKLDDLQNGTRPEQLQIDDRMLLAQLPDNQHHQGDDGQGRGRADERRGEPVENPPAIQCHLETADGHR